MEKNKNAIMGLLLVSLCLGLLWGVSPSMAGSIGQAAENQYKKPRLFNSSGRSQD